MMMELYLLNAALTLTSALP